MYFKLNFNKNLVLMYAISLLQGMVFYGSVSTLYRQAVGVTLFQITLMESLSMVLTIVLEIPWGILADKIGYKRTFVICSFLFFVSKLVFWRADSFADFLTERILLDAVISGLSGVDTSILYLSAKGKDTQRIFGFLNTMSVAGLFLASGMYSLFIGKDYRMAGLLTAVSYGIAAFLSLWLTEVREETKETERKNSWQIFLSDPSGTVWQEKRDSLSCQHGSGFRSVPDDNRSFKSAAVSKMRSHRQADWSAVSASDHL